jgi:hypothetical protein
VVADALSRACVPKVVILLITDFDHMGVSLCYAGTAQEETQMLIQSSLLERVRGVEQQDHLIQEVHKRIANGRPQEFSIDEIVVVPFQRASLCATKI